MTSEYLREERKEALKKMKGISNTGCPFSCYISAIDKPL